MFKIQMKRLTPEAKLPVRAFTTDAGLDIFSLEAATVGPGMGYTFKTGVAAKFIPGYLGLMADRSSMAKKGWKLSGGICDPLFSGELVVVLRNISNVSLTVDKGDRIAQLIILPMFTPEVEEIYHIEEKEGRRNQSGFGSSGT